MQIKHLTTAIALSCLSLTTTASYAEVTANIAASSNYFWRGITQTADQAAVSGGIDYSNESGFYAGTWVSNIDFGTQTSASYEMDFYAGFSQSMGDFSYDVGYVYYAYPDAASSIDFGELYGAVAWQWLEGKVSYLTHAQNDASAEEDMLYVELNAAFEILNGTELAFHLGQSSGDTVQEWYGEDRYIDYGVTLAKDGFSLGLLQTDLDDDDFKVFVGYSIDFTL
ncbi:hypothetical protein PULV_a3626 [Pseudoalteromonas ulvae UL12]|uniref:Outer membrane protein beta-barrel domain-containing protein n=1 Tax=Pseudoalteromonas ulvae TaxID=107327 RepID=A0A244CL78_PSEDV|nr:TorF family putative porin [Pseudoalteromonas ulvae]MBE0361968.1 hypothetical protein [Pseudoalteromonas ulvae UL12]OUL56040.1 hypothetical protein B1199_20270 [Pseudoalteromonas ulvae]